MRNAALILLSLAAAVLPVSGRAEPNPSLRKTIQANYDTIDSAMSRHDVKTMMSLYDANFLSIDRQGDYNPTGRDEMREICQRMFSKKTGGLQEAVIQSHDKVLTVKAIAGGVVVTTQGSFTGHLVSGVGNVLYHRSAGRYQDFWARKGSQYLLTQSRVLEEQSLTKINGRPIAKPE